MNADYAFLWGLIGGLVAEAAILIKLKTIPTKDWPKYLKTMSYYFIAIFTSILGGLIAHLYADVIQLNKIMAFHMGSSAPFMLKGLSKKTPKIEND